SGQARAAGLRGTRRPLAAADPWHGWRHGRRLCGAVGQGGCAGELRPVWLRLPRSRRIRGARFDRAPSVSDDADAAGDRKELNVSNAAASFPLPRKREREQAGGDNYAATACGAAPKCGWRENSSAAQFTKTRTLADRCRFCGYIAEIGNSSVCQSLITST